MKILMKDSSISHIQVEIPARLKSLYPVTSLAAPEAVQIIEIFDGGLTIRAGSPYIPRMVIEVIYQHQVRLGSVVSCTHGVGGFSLDVKLLEEW